MVYTKPTQTSEILGVSNMKMLWRGLLQRCPACNSRGTHDPYFTFVKRCPDCSLKFERIEGHVIGYIGLNTMVTFSVTFVVLLVGAILTKPDIPVVPLLASTLIPAAILPVVFLRSAHTLWTAIDLIMRPIEIGEIDPRFVVRENPPRPTSRSAG